jgi:hypothetical protein
VTPDLSQVVWLHHDGSGWPQTATLGPVCFVISALARTGPISVQEQSNLQRVVWP